MDLGTLGYLLTGCFVLGMLHGVVPDEHTWPITFAYSVGTTTGRGGIRSGAWFSLAFTAQRAMMSVIVYLALVAALGIWGFNLATQNSVNGPVYLAVGAAMAVAGWLILSERVPHFHPLMRVSKKDLAKHTSSGSGTGPTATVPVHWCLIHGFVSGFGTDTGVLSTWIYLITLPFLVSARLWPIAWLPGALFGLGTLVVLMVIGFFFGETLQLAKRVGPNRIAHFGRLVGARTLLLGGLVFVVLGPLYWSGLYSRYLGSVDLGQFVVVLILVVLAVPLMVLTWREVRKLPREFPRAGDGTPDRRTDGRSPETTPSEGPV